MTRRRAGGMQRPAGRREALAAPVEHLLGVRRDHVPRAQGVRPLVREQQGRVVVATLNRPATRNALSEEMISALTDLVGSIAQDKTVVALVIVGDRNGLAARRGDIQQAERARVAKLADVGVIERTERIGSSPGSARRLSGLTRR